MSLSGHTGVRMENAQMNDNHIVSNGQQQEFSKYQYEQVTYERSQKLRGDAYEGFGKPARILVDIIPQEYLNCAFLSGWIYGEELNKFQKTALVNDNVDYPKFRVSDHCNDKVYGKSIMLNNNEKKTDEEKKKDFFCHAYHPINEMTGELMCWAIIYTETNEELTIYLVFRGTHTMQDVIIDVSYLPMPVPIQDTGKHLLLHSGIVLSVQVEYEAIKKSLQELISNKKKTVKFYCTGHSLGGGYAQVFGVLLLNDVSWDIKVVFEDPALLHEHDGEEPADARVTLNMRPIAIKSCEMSKKSDTPNEKKCYFTVMTLASPLLSWVEADEKTINELRALNVKREKKDGLGKAAAKVSKFSRFLFSNSEFRSEARYYVTKGMLEDVSYSDCPTFSYMTNIVNLRDVVPRAQFAVKSKWTLQNMVKTDVPNIGFFLNKTKNLTAWNASDLYRAIPDVLLGYRPLGNSLVITASLMNRNGSSEQYKLELVDCSKRNDWYMLEYSKTIDPDYPNYLPYPNSKDDGWNAVDHGINYYLKHLAACGDFPDWRHELTQHKKDDIIIYKKKEVI